MLTIDGSMGEGGGQVLRSALALSMVTQEPFRMERIRARRRLPGLRHQHLTALEAAAAVSGAAVRGRALGRTSLEFRPEAVRAGRYHFDVGTAGSTTLVLQTVLPALATADGPSHLLLEGGTHNPWSPPFDFLARTFLPLLRRMGTEVELALERYGFHPAGGGRIAATVRPGAGLKPLHLEACGARLGSTARAVVAGLPADIADRELAAVREALGIEGVRAVVEEGVGNVLMIEVESEEVCEIFTGFGRKGVPAEEVARSAVAEARAYLEAGVPVGRHLADQLMLPLAMAGSGSFQTLPLSAHATTQIEIIETFLGRRLSWERLGEAVVRVHA
ncbi:MAG: RNA 3'-terminal phosphate cyclase [Planctomycetota bacterium]|jgi:RNA 3'-terminal phosphate cyclase (ATP)